MRSQARMAGPQERVIGEGVGSGWGGCRRLQGVVGGRMTVQTLLLVVVGMGLLMLMVMLPLCGRV